MDKEHFNRILRDVEANTLRLQEHGKDVLILERVVKQRGLTAFKYVASNCCFVTSIVSFFNLRLHYFHPDMIYLSFIITINISITFPENNF